jgi:DNA-binding NarL/FixJ family response regulator
MAVAVQLRRDVVVPIHAEAQRHQIGQWLADAEHEIRQSLAHVEASLDGYRRALSTIAELREEIGGNLPADDRRRAPLPTIRSAPPYHPSRGVEGWHEPAILTIARAPEPRHTTPLSPRETEVLAHLAAGQSNKEIAYLLSLSTRTVERHINNIYRKIGAQNRAEATAYALRRHIA